MANEFAEVFLSDVSLESLRAVVVTTATVFLWRWVKRNHELSNSASKLLIAGLLLFAVGSILDITDEFDSLNWLVVIGNTPTQAFLEKVVCYTGGLVLVAIGFWKWLPFLTKINENEGREQHAQKMETLGKFAGGIAHDMNNVLTIINGHADMLRATSEPNTPSSKTANSIVRACNRGARLIKQLMSYSRRDTSKLEKASVNECVVEVQDMLTRLLGANNRISIKLASGIPKAIFDRGAFEQALMNLVTNARDAMPDGGEIGIETMLISVEHSHAIDTVEPIPAGTYAAIAVNDSGCGMDTETRSRLFEPFFTTKESGKGTGFGLVTVYTFVKQAKGGIRVASALGHGSSFTVLLPAVQETPEHSISNIIEITGPPKSRQLLLVEDDDTVRKILLQVAEAGGYDVIEANSGEQALGILNQVNGLDILVTDVVMPGISGPEVAAEARRSFPDIPVLYVSGYPRTELDPSEFEREYTTFLQKPFSHKAMLEVMDQLIELAPEPKINIDANTVETV